MLTQNTENPNPIVVLPCHQLLCALRDTPGAWMQFLSRRNLLHHSHNCAVHFRYINDLIRGWSTAYCDTAACSNSTNSTATCWSVPNRRTAPCTAPLPILGVSSADAYSKDGWSMGCHKRCRRLLPNTHRSQGPFDSIRWLWLMLSPSMPGHPITASVRSLLTRPSRQVESPSDWEER